MISGISINVRRPFFRRDSKVVNQTKFGFELNSLYFVFVESLVQDKGFTLKPLYSPPL